MREFTCASLGNKCGWKYFAKTEELLADVVAVHLRDVHGVRQLDQNMVGKIKNVFANPSPLEARETERLILKEYSCDMGQKCDWHYIAQTEDLIVDGVAIHAREAHGIKEFTLEMKTKVENALREWRG